MSGREVRRIFPLRAAKAACAKARDVLNFNATPFFGKTGNHSDRMARTKRILQLQRPLRAFPVQAYQSPPKNHRRGRRLRSMRGWRKERQHGAAGHTDSAEEMRYVPLVERHAEAHFRGRGPEVCASRGRSARRRLPRLGRPQVRRRNDLLPLEQVGETVT